MADFLKAYKKTAVTEGGYTNNSDDKGNYYKNILIGTNKGISAPVLAAYLKRTPTVQEMKELSTETAKAIYKKNYWDVMKGDLWNNQDSATHVYDMGVNAGIKTAIKLWQHSLGLLETGNMDTTTLNRTNLLV